MILIILHLSLLIRKITCVDIVSSEKDSVQKERSDKHVSYMDLDNRKFLHDLDDDEWHVAHLKDTEFSRRSECVGDTFQDRVKRYRKALKNDGALVEFVSADPIPFDASDLEDSNKACKTPTNYTIFLKRHEHKTIDERNATSKPNPGDVEKTNTEKKETSFENGTISEGVHTATTVKANPPLGKGSKVQNKKESRRASEYQFSSIEYYDEVTQFDENKCPDDILVITLEIDNMLKTPDVECELLTEWRSLE